MRNITPKSAPEFASLQAFYQFMRDEERTTYTVEEIQALNYRTHLTQEELRQQLENEGFSLQKRDVPKPQPRGFTTSNNDRWYGPGSERTHGGK